MARREDKLRVAIVGCGQIADAHFKELLKIDNATAVGACDLHLDLAERARAVYGVERAFDDVERMLVESRPEVVHITTPANSHKDIALQCLRAGCHVYVEKPFALDVAEARQVLEAAESAGLLVCTGHNELFDPVWLRARAIVQSGALGALVHVTSVQGFDLSGPFGSALVRDANHWVRRLPGGIFQNTISHPIYKVVDCLPDFRPRIRATWFGRDAQFDFPTELRAFMQGDGVSADLFVSSAARPVERYVRIHGTERTIEVDFEGRVIRQLEGITARGPFVSMQVPLRQLAGAGRHLASSLWRFVQNDIHYFAGMNLLFRRFYAAVQSGEPNPIGAAEIERVTQVMDNVFLACSESRSDGWVDWPRPDSAAVGNG